MKAPPTFAKAKCAQCAHFQCRAFPPASSSTTSISNLVTSAPGPGRGESSG
jgi:hypothetical protein